MHHLRKYLTRMVLSSIAAALLLAGKAQVAQANTLTFSDSIPYTDTNWMRTLIVSKFNPSLGTLDRVDLFFNENFRQQVMMENTSPSPGQMTSTVSNALSAQRLDGSFINIPVNSLFYVDNLGGFDGVKDMGGTSGITHPQVINSAHQTYVYLAGNPDLAYFYGVGQLTFALNANVFENFTTSTGNAFWKVITQANGDVTVRYTFTPTAPPPPPSIPEPTSLMLLSTGLLGWLRFRKSKTAL